MYIRIFKSNSKGAFFYSFWANVRANALSHPARLPPKTLVLMETRPEERDLLRARKRKQSVLRKKERRNIALKVEVRAHWRTKRWNKRLIILKLNWIKLNKIIFPGKNKWISFNLKGTKSSLMKWNEIFKKYIYNIYKNKINRFGIFFLRVNDNIKLNKINIPVKIWWMNDWIN